MEVKKLPTLPTLMKKKQVAAYARVSSGKDAMLRSLSAQVSYLEEDDIRERFIQVINRLFADKENVIASAKKQEQTFLTEQFIHALTAQTELLTEWKEATFKMLVESITVMPDGKLLFKLQNGTVVEN